MQSKSASAGPGELWAVWVEDYVAGITARCVSNDDVVDLIVRDRDICGIESAAVSNMGVSYACRNT